MAMHPWHEQRKGLEVRDFSSGISIKFDSPQHVAFDQLQRHICKAQSQQVDQHVASLCLLDIVRTNNCDKFLKGSSFPPDLQKMYKHIQEDYLKVCGEIQSVFDALSLNSKDQKAFAQSAAVHKHFKTVLLQMRREGYADLREYLFAEPLISVVHLLSRCSPSPFWRMSKPKAK